MQDSSKSTYNEIMTSKDVMDFLQISRATIQRMCKKGELIRYKLSGRIYFKKSEIITAVEAGKETLPTEVIPIQATETENA